MASLEFENLPLLRVEYALTFAQPDTPSLDTICKLRSVLKDSLPRVSDFAGPAVGPVSFMVGVGMGAGFDDLKRGVGLGLRENRLTCAWQCVRPDMEYVRYPALKDLLVSAWNTVGQPKITSILGVYANLMRHDEGVPHRFVKAEYFPALGQNRAKATDMRASWDLGSSQFRLHVYGVNEGFMLESICQSMVGEDDPIVCLDKAHDELNSIFADVITEEAKDAWKLKRN